MKEPMIDKNEAIEKALEEIGETTGVVMSREMESNRQVKRVGTIMIHALTFFQTFRRTQSNGTVTQQSKNTNALLS